MAASGSGYGMEDCEEGIPTEYALLSVLAAFAVAFGILYMASTTNTGRKKREITISDQIQDILWMSKISLYVPTYNLTKQIPNLISRKN